MGHLQIKTALLLSILTVLVCLPMQADQNSLPRWEQGEQGKYRLVSAEGAALTDYRYDSVFAFSHDVAVVMIGQGIGMVNCKGKEIAKPCYSFAPAFFGEVPIIFSYRNQKRYLGCVYMNAGGATWLDAEGKIMQTGSKLMFTMKDKIPDGLWDY